MSRQLSISPVDTDKVRRWPYSYDTPKSPRWSYSGPEFYGVLENKDAAEGPANFVRYRVHAANPDQMQVWGSEYKTARNEIYGMIFFKTPVGPAESIMLKAGDSFSINYTRVATGTFRVRMAARSEGVWYLYGTALTANGAYKLEDLDANLWGEWDPEAESLSDTGVDFDTPGRMLKDISAVGFYFNLSRTNTGGAPRMNLTSFEADLSVVPLGSLISLK